MEVLGKNGKPLHGAAKQAVLKKQLVWQDEEVGISLLSITDRVFRLERQAKCWPLTVIAALFFGCGAGKIVKPDLAVLAVGCAGASAGAIIAIERQK